MIMDAHLRLNKYQHCLDNLKEQLEQTVFPKHTKMLTTTMNTTSLRQAGKRK